MTTGIFVDSNILIYSLDPNEPTKRIKAANFVRLAALSHRLVTSPQTLNECYRVLTDRRKIMPRPDARRFIGSLLPSCTAPIDASTTAKGWEVQDATGFAWWDCVMLSSALKANCGLFVTEDLEHGRVIDGMRIVDLFRDEQGLEALMN
ncbi:putative nucleic acid-binding protein [Kaistia hirudinis]|uniref:Ribonuclease VapC n=1 Tax=Kaistia hirudinis TaxID=1293440 RepID=A0A840AWH0_9HYPH|nr:PIN domain-containing protein [Kaistia hirudinis]MBB3933141.1 putative nucleic acid-binding protein [Kaistia hirudinis]